MRGLASDDIAGIRAIYSNNAARTPDAYNVNGNNNGSENMATSINGDINYSALTALVPNLDITTAGQSEYFAFTAPYGETGTLDLDVQSSGLSLLAPKVTVYSSNGTTVLAAASGAGQYGTTLTVSVPNMVVGQTYYVQVQGADNTQMGTGRYAVGLNFNGATPPTEASPIVAVRAGNPQHAGSGQADGANGNGPYVAAVPVITGISPDNGVSSQDGVTNNPRISINGTAPAFDTVTVFLNGQAIGQTTALVNNTWTFNNTATPLSDGDDQFTATATDSAGYSTPLSYSYEVVIDTHTPQPPALNDISPDTGLGLTDGITNDNHPTFSGTTEPFAVVNLYSNGSSQPFGTTEADAGGSWSYSVGQAGQITYPSGTLGSVASWVNSVLSGLVGVSQTGGSGQTLADGKYSVTATAMDVAGTLSAASSPMTIVIDTQKPPAPKVTGISPDTGKSSTDGITTAHNLMISGTAGSGDLVVVLLNGTAVGSAMAGSNGAWSFNDIATTLPDGNYAITAVAVDVAGNISDVPGAFNATIETLTPPAIAGASLITGTQGLAGNQQGLSVAGTAPPNDQVQVYLGGSLLGTANANGQGAWSYVYAPTSTTVPGGTYNFSAVSMDQSGNVSASSAPLSIVLTAPSAPVRNDVSPDTGASNTDGITNSKNPMFSGTAQAGTTINLYANGNNNPFGTTTTTSSETWSYTIPGGGWGDGTCNVTATATATTGMVSAASAPLEVVIDTQSPQSPQVTGISPDTGKSNDGITTARNLILSGTAPAGDTVTVFLNGGLLGTTTATTTGAWTFDNTAMALSNGNDAITALATDIAGNVSHLSNAYNVTVETVPMPVIAGGSLVIGTQGLAGNQQGLSIVGTAPPNDQVELYLGSCLLGTANANGQGAWCYVYAPTASAVPAGTYDFSAVAMDQSGNVSAASPTFSLGVGGGPMAGTPQYAAGVLSGQATPGSLVSIVAGDLVIGVVTADASGHWRLTPALAKGQHTIMVDAANSSGNTSLLSGPLTVSI
jgi:hypothetical protein